MLVVLVSHYKGLETVLILLMFHSPYNFFLCVCVDIKFYTMTKCYFVLLAHVLLMTEPFSPACKSLITVLTAAILKHALMHSGKKGA